MKKTIGFWAALLLAVPGHALAQVTGQPQDWAIGMQLPASPVTTFMYDFHNMLLVIIGCIVAFVLGLLLFVMIRFNSRANPIPSRVTHNTLLEIIWTTIPILILLVIAVPSFKLLYYTDKAPNPVMTVKAIGHQWYWEYEYPDNGDFHFVANIVQDKDLKPGQPRLLTTDNDVVLPVGVDIRILTTATDVIHSWSVPAFGVKKDAVPGRLNETWVHIDRPGMYYGQCSQICGQNHGFMPIAVRAVSMDEFKAWVETAKKQFADGSTPATPTKIATAP